MANKWQICIDVDAETKDLLVSRLGFLADTPEQQVVVYDLKAQINLAWIERTVELIPPPSEHSQHLPVYVDRAEVGSGGGGL